VNPYEKNIFIEILCTVLFALANCRQTNETDTQKETKQEITISGSGSGVIIMKMLEPDFENEYTSIDLIFLPSSGTKKGLETIAEGLVDLIMSARDMDDTEKTQYPNLIQKTLFKDAMVLAVNKNVDIIDLTKEQIKKIHTGEITDWNETGNTSGRIIVLDREEHESSKILLREYIIGDSNVTEDAIMMLSPDAMDQSIETTRYSIGQTSLGAISYKNLTIKPLSIDGIKPSLQTLDDGSYPMVRNYGIIYKKESESTIMPLLIFLASDEIQARLRRYQMVRVNQ